MTTPKAADVKKGITVLWETLQCPICLDLLTAPVSTKCDHQFCKFCITRLLDGSKQNRANCPVCKFEITKRSLQESPGFQRLVIGLQDMIQAYEHDTCTNYFTGVPQQRRNTKIRNAETSQRACKLSSGETFGTEQDNMGTIDKASSPQSCSSTVAAQNGFAQLMGLEDSASVTAENEGLDSGLGDVPPTSDKKTSSSADHLVPGTAKVGRKATSTCAAGDKRSSVNLEKSSVSSEANKEKPCQQHVRRSSRKKQKKDNEPEKILEQKKDLKPDKIFEQKKKRSLEKVAEWLLKVPAEEELELEKPVHSADESDSSLSTLDVEPLQVGLSTVRRDHGKALEEQVFGAVYKRRGSKVGEPQMAKEVQTCKRFSKLRKKNEDGLCEERQTVENDVSSDFFKASEQMEGEENLGDKHQGEHRVPEAAVVQPETTPATGRTCQSLQQLDDDLQEQTQSKSKGTDEKSRRRKGKTSKLSTKKPTKVAKPLVLVGVQNRDTSPEPNKRCEKVEVQIETYPSSEDQSAPGKKSARRSRRLQLFAEEVGGSHKEATLKSTATKKDNSAETQTEDANDETENPTLRKSVNLSQGAKRNRCVYEGDIGGIESMENSGRTSLTQADAEVPEAKTPAGAVGDCNVSVVPDSTSPTGPSVVGPTLESEKPENNCHPKSQQEVRVTEAKHTIEEREDCKNDSELDTEQLIRSFKTAKRKSFHLGKPTVKRSRGLKEEIPGSHCDFSNTELSGSINDVISPSNSPTQIKQPYLTMLEASHPNGNGLVQDGDVENCPSRSSFSSGLSPNKVSKHHRDSPVSVIPQVVDSGLCFTAIGPETSRGSQLTEGQDDCNLEKTRGGILKYPSIDKAESIFSEESSLTPNGLETPGDQLIQEANANSGGGEVSNESSIKINPRKKRRRRTPRLEASSGSNSSEAKEEFPTLDHIFGRSDRLQAETKDRGDIGETERCEEVCGEADTAGPASRPSASPNPDQLDSSQGSVDLFGTPDECDPLENDVGISIESSQFSSEVLVTQQKLEMQKELVRLEKLMTLVSEVLQEKEASPAREVPKETRESNKNMGPGVHRLLLNDKDQDSDRKGTLDAKPRPSEDKVGTEPALATCGSISEAAVHHPTQAWPAVKNAKSPHPSSAARTAKNCDSAPDGQEDKENNSPPEERSKAKLVLVSSGLGPDEQRMVKKFAKKTGGRVVPQVTPEVTHIIMHTDDQLVCARTLKYFLGIASRKWVVSFQWISECFKEKKLLEESLFEVRGDMANGPNHQGPLKARTTEDSNLLMKGYKICFQGPFTDMSTDEMEWMVELCGATVVKDPNLLDGKQRSHQIVIVQPRSDSSSSSYRGLSRRATVVTRGWLLDTVATYTLQNYSSYTV